MSDTNYYDPAVVGLSGGGAVTIWGERTGSADGLIEARLIDALGQPFGSSFVVSGGEKIYSYEPEIVALEGGGFFALWTTPGEYTTDFQGQPVEIDPAFVGLRVYGPQGVGQSIVWRVQDENNAPENSRWPMEFAAPEGAQMADGSVAAAWLRTDNATGQTTLQFRHLAIDDDAAALGGTKTLNLGAGLEVDSRVQEFSLAPLSGGGFAVVFEGADGSGAGRQRLLPAPLRRRRAGARARHAAHGRDGRGVRQQPLRLRRCSR